VSWLACVSSRYPTVLAFKALRPLRVLGACSAPAAGSVGATQAIPPVASTGVPHDRIHRSQRPARHVLEALYDSNCRSLRQLARFARDSSLPGCQRFVSGLTLAQALLAEELSERPVFATPRAVADFLQLHFARQAHESFAVLCLDARHALLAFEDLFLGTLTQTSVYPREIIKRALHHNAAAVILAHNHPLC
jgi:RadC-like JAB domain